MQIIDYNCTFEFNERDGYVLHTKKEFLPDSQIFKAPILTPVRPFPALWGSTADEASSTGLPQTSSFSMQTAFQGPFVCNTIVDYILLGMCPEHQKLEPFPFVIVDPNLVSFELARAKTAMIEGRDTFSMTKLIQREIYPDTGLLASEDVNSTVESKLSQTETPLQPEAKKRRIYVSPIVSKSPDSTSKPARYIVSEYRTPLPMYRKQLTAENLVRFVQGCPKSKITLPNLILVSTWY